MTPYYLAIERRAGRSLRRMVLFLILAVLASFALFWLDGDLPYQLLDLFAAVACWWLSGVHFCDATRFFELLDREREGEQGFFEP